MITVIKRSFGEFSRAEYFQLYDRLLDMMWACCERAKKEGFITAHKIIEDNYIDYKKHSLLLRCDNGSKRQADIRIEFEPIFLWFLDEASFAHQLALYGKRVYDGVKKAFTGPLQLIVIANTVPDSS